MAGGTFDNYILGGFTGNTTEIKEIIFRFIKSF